MKPYGKTLSEKTVDCLRLCALPIKARTEMLVTLDKKWSLKVIYATIYNHGHLFEWGVSHRWAWLTDEGKAALADIDGPMEPPK